MMDKLPTIIWCVGMAAMLIFIVVAEVRRFYGPEHRHWGAMGKCDCNKCQEVDRHGNS